MGRTRLQLTRRLVLALVWLARPLAAAMLLAFRLMPEPLGLSFARPVGRLTRIGKKREILSRLRVVLGPQLPAPAFWPAHVVHLGRSVIEPVYFYHLPDAELVSRVSLSGAEHLAGALAQGRGAMLFLNHLGNPGAIVAGLGLRGYDLTIAGNALVASILGEEVPLNYFEGVVQRMFARGHVRRALLGDRLPQRVTETLARNGLFAMFIDFPVGRKHNEPLAFGHANMNVSLGPAILALRHQVPVLTVTCLRTGADNHHHLAIQPPLEPTSGPAHAAAAALMQSALDRLLPDVLAHPDQWWPWDWAQISPRA
jgi:lauroyl/myristoyl acyltransferase